MPTQWKYCANAGFFGLRRDRFTQYQPQRSLTEKLALVSGIDGVTGVELKYPADLEDAANARSLLDEHKLELSAVNVDIKDASYFRYGALSARSDDARERAIGLLKEGMDVAADFGVNRVTTCSLADGYDYAFQMDHGEAWKRLIASVAEAAGHRRDVDLLLEYQKHEPHAHIMLETVGKLLHLFAEVDAENVGANLDVGHAFAAQESPAESAALLASGGRLRYIHTNDNTGDGGDWDMISGATHFWDWLELVFTLRRVGYDGWLGGDIAPKHMAPEEAYRVNFLMIERMTHMVERIGMGTLTEMVEADGKTGALFDLLTSKLMTEDGSSS